MTIYSSYEDIVILKINHLILIYFVAAHLYHPESPRNYDLFLPSRPAQNLLHLPALCQFIHQLIEVPDLLC